MKIRSGSKAGNRWAWADGLAREQQDEHRDHSGRESRHVERLLSIVDRGDRPRSGPANGSLGQRLEIGDEVGELLGRQVRRRSPPASPTAPACRRSSMSDRFSSRRAPEDSRICTVEAPSLTTKPVKTRPSAIAKL